MSARLLVRIEGSNGIPLRAIFEPEGEHKRHALVKTLEEAPMKYPFCLPGSAGDGHTVL
jgi:hypothetical protein